MDLYTELTFQHSSYWNEEEIHLQVQLKLFKCYLGECREKEIKGIMFLFSDFISILSDILVCTRMVCQRYFSQQWAAISRPIYANVGRELRPNIYFLTGHSAGWVKHLYYERSSLGNQRPLFLL